MGSTSKFRDYLIAKDMTTISIKRVISTVKAAVNLAISEHGLNCQGGCQRANWWFTHLARSTQIDASLSMIV